MTLTTRHMLSGAAGIALLLGVAACGGDDDGSSQDASAQNSSESSDSGDVEPTETGEDSGPDGPVGARVVIGDQEFTATTQVSCIEMGGALSAYFLTDDELTSIDIDLPPEDWATNPQSTWDPPGVRIDVGDEFQYVAGFTELESPGGPYSAIASFDIGDGHSQGAGSFVDNFEIFSSTATPQVVEGSFDVTCE